MSQMSDEPAEIARGTIAPELRPMQAKMAWVDFSRPAMRTFLNLLARIMPTGRTPGVKRRKVRCGDTRGRLHIPTQAGDGATGALLWIHGGGYLIGSARQDDSLCGAVAASLGIPVLAVEYALAPRQPFPVALDQCHSAWDWLVVQASALGIDPARIAIGGDSAGGGLAACLVQRLCDREPGAVAAQWLFEPMLDDRTGAEELGVDPDPKHYFWKSAHNRLGWGAYLGQPAGSPDVPRFAVAARFDPLPPLPPTWIGIGTEDLFFDECVTYAKRLRQAGTLVETQVAIGAPHGFHSWAPKSTIAIGFLRAAHAWLAQVLGGKLGQQ